MEKRGRRKKLGTLQMQLFWKAFAHKENIKENTNIGSQFGKHNILQTGQFWRRRTVLEHLMMTILKAIAQIKHRFETKLQSNFCVYSNAKMFTQHPLEAPEEAVLGWTRSNPLKVSTHSLGYTCNNCLFLSPPFLGVWSHLLIYPDDQNHRNHLGLLFHLDCLA